MFYGYLNRYHQYNVEKHTIAACSVFLRLNTLGYTKSGLDCIDDNECFSDDICQANYDCVNTDGTYYCECLQGYEHIDGNCLELDECLKNIHDCDDLGLDYTRLD